MEPSIDGLCQFVQNFIITLDSPIFANRYLVGFVAETQVMNVLRVFGYACEIKCEWRKVVNLVSIYQCYEHFCTVFCFSFYLIYLCISLSQFIFPATLFVSNGTIYKYSEIRTVINLVTQWILNLSHNSVAYYDVYDVLKDNMTFDNEFPFFFYAIIILQKFRNKLFHSD